MTSTPLPLSGSPRRQRSRSSMVQGAGGSSRSARCRRSDSSEVRWLCGTSRQVQVSLKTGALASTMSSGLL
eukprot:3932528-Pyramimonas_sp.AAC.1